jgi:hypothetical protein
LQRNSIEPGLRWSNGGGTRRTQIGRKPEVIRWNVRR